MSEAKDLDQYTIDAVSTVFQELVGGVLERFSAKIQDIEDRVESIEKQIATLIVGYGEQAVYMEALVAQLAFATDEQRSNFTNSLNDARKKMLEVMRDASATNLADENQHVAAAVEDLATEKLSDSDS